MPETAVGEAPQPSLSEWEAHLLTYGLSEWERNLLHHFREHTDAEAGLLQTYAGLAESAPSEFVRYLLAMLLEDEHRHHRMFQELTNSLIGEANLTRIEPSVPPIGPVRDAGELRELSARLLRLEEQDQRELRRLRRELKPVRATTMWDLLVALAEHDTKKHRLVLQFVHDHAAAAA